ncbi:ArsR family transcriptional regulator [Viridibacillus sp. NPDC093762]|uniref:ArsR family transcriptional regulator n=1 Tax=Viridibacillus sp. NPDC093762 TaxID=3390720 RepID=UPI003D004F11
MKIRLGIIGVEDNYKLVESVAKENSKFITSSFSHSTEEEIIDILETHQNDVDMWLFSGYITYNTARLSGKSTKPMFFVTLKGSCLYKALYHALYEDKMHINDLSFDCFTPSQIKQIAEELGSNFNPDYLKQYVNSFDLIVEHHFELWKKGMTKAAVTCIWDVSNKLKKLGVPVFRVNPTKTEIESALNMALLSHEMLIFKNRQIAVQLFEVAVLTGLSMDMYSSDELYQKEIQITQKLLNYTKKIQGSLKKAASGRYVIFSTRGALSKITQDFTEVPDIAEIHRLSQLSVTCGIGFGQSVFEAEIHAGKALIHAKEYGNGTWMVFLDKKMIKGPLGKLEKNKYFYGSKQFQTISELTSLSVSTINKVDSILETIGKTEITANELAQHMEIIPRSARRIIVQLMKKGFAREIAEETPHPRGRPRKIYQITL